MGMPVEKVEVGFDLTDSPVGPFFRLDDPVSGRLDNTDWVLAGLFFIDVTDRVRRFSVNRGRPSVFSVFPAGVAEVEFNNHDRAFDPLYVDSPFYGNIIPRRELRITSGTAVQFTGWIDDWDLAYLPDGDSIASALAVDATSILATRVVAAGTPVAQLSGERINTVLSQISVAWPESLRDIDPGETLMGTQAIDDNTIALNYLQSIAASEPGDIFVGKNGSVTYRDRSFAPDSNSLVYFGGTGIPFASLEVVYGSELLYNEIVVSRKSGGTAVATDLDSVAAYGLRNLTQSDLLMASNLDALDLAVSLADRYSTPEYRVQTLEIQLMKLDGPEQEKVLGVELGSICKVTFTPNNIGDPIEQFIQVIRIEHVVDPQIHTVLLGFRQIKAASLVLDDAEFGKLDTYGLGR